MRDIGICVHSDDCSCLRRALALVWSGDVQPPFSVGQTKVCILGLVCLGHRTGHTVRENTLLNAYAHINPTESINFIQYTSWQTGHQ